MADKQFVDLTSVRVDLTDGFTEFTVVCGKGTALHHGDLQRIDTEDLFEVLIVLIQIAEIDSQLILKNMDTDRTVDQVITL